MSSASGRPGNTALRTATPKQDTGSTARRTPKSATPPELGVCACRLHGAEDRPPKPETVSDSVMKKVDKLGKGIILMHDFQKHTAEALPELMHRLKAGGYKVVQMRPK